MLGRFPAGLLRSTAYVPDIITKVSFGFSLTHIEAGITGYPLRPKGPADYVNQ